ncbi:MAG TPA: STAS domain-containing protein [Candidatus Kapabacteria bacterium]|nr:STAS domain-containing protein [Candidatus Kapabacteria bacterium]
MNYTIEHKDNIVIFELKNKTVESNISADLKARMLIMSQPDIDALIINLSSVEAIDSSGLGALLLANRQLSEYDIPVALVGVGEFVRSLMNMTKIDEVFEFYDNVEEALASLEARKEEE